MKFEQKKIFVDEKTDRSVGVLLGNVIGDALGAPFEFNIIRYGEKEMIDGFSETEIRNKKNYNVFRLKPGQWTDDDSMALCLADTILVKNNFDPIDLRIRFWNWNRYGYCTAFGYDNSRTFKHSVGLGGNISLSMKEFQENQIPYTKAGNTETSGNGSVMRNAPIPMFFSNDMFLALEMAANQSRTTHQGIEAAECCRLLTYFTVQAIQGKSKDTIFESLREFQTTSESVYKLANSEAEENDPINRNWNWRDPFFKYSPARAEKMPGYIGSYAMDAMSMALHVIYTTDDFKSALLKSANLRGDSDSVSAVVGQMAGSLYGTQSIPRDWLETIFQWDPKGSILLRAYKLSRGKEKH